MRAFLVMGMVVTLCLAAHPIPARAESATAPPVNLRLVKLEAALAAQHEARDRQADAFDAAVSRMEFINAALAAFIAIAGIGGSLLAIRWIRAVAREQVAAQIDSAIHQTGQQIFEARSEMLRDEFEEKFSRQYAEYEKLLDEK
jgi:hypothetical protein